MTYNLALEDGNNNFDELEPLYRQHYGEMQSRLSSQGIDIADYNPRWDIYRQYWSSGFLLNFTARKDGKAIGCSNVYLTNDMHNGEFIAKEDSIYVLPEHRNGIGRKLTKFILDELRKRGVQRAYVTTQTDLRVGLLCERLGFRHVAQEMVYNF